MIKNVAFLWRLSSNKGAVVVERSRMLVIDGRAPQFESSTRKIFLNWKTKNFKYACVPDAWSNQCAKNNEYLQGHNQQGISKNLLYWDAVAYILMQSWLWLQRCTKVLGTPWPKVYPGPCFWGPSVNWGEAPHLNWWLSRREEVAWASKVGFERNLAMLSSSHIWILDFSFDGGTETVTKWH